MVTRFHNFVSKLGYFNEQIWFSSSTKRSILLTRFEVKYDWMDLTESLKFLGVHSIFSAETSNLTNISDDPLYVSAIVHKAIVKVRG